MAQRRSRQLHRRGKLGGSAGDDAPVPTDEQVDSAATLEELRKQEAAILESTRRHEEALARLQSRYQRVRRKMYREHKKEVIASDNEGLAKFQGGCAKPRKLAGLTKAEADAQAHCLQTERATVDESDLGRLLRKHLWQQPPAIPTAQCLPFRGVEVAQLQPRQRECLAKTGEARWTAEGLVDADAASGNACGRRWLGTAEARCLLAGHDVLFIGNSVVRRQMYALLDLLAGPRAHRQLTDFRSVDLRAFNETARIKRSWVWDQDNATYGYHAAQLFTIDLATGDHRFSMPHVAPCGLGPGFACFNPSRLRQWLEPGSGGGTEELGADWRGSKWATREWRPLVSLRLAWPAKDAAPAASCAARQLATAGAYDGGVDAPPEPPPVPPVGRRGRPRRARDGLAARLRARLLLEVEKHFGAAADVRAWLPNVSVHVEQPLQPHPDDAPLGAPANPTRRGRRGAAGRGAVGGAAPNVWLYFPTYHGEREDFNGFCEDKPCACTGRLAQCHRHPECQAPERSGRGKHVCEPMARGSAVFVDRARAFAEALRARGKLLGHAVERVRVTPFYDDCWERRGRCQGHRPCREPVDAAWTCRATAMLCPAAGPDGWPGMLARAKAWVPPGHPSASLLYLFDGQTSDLIDETFRTWGPRTVGYGSSAMVFGPQFGSFHGAAPWQASFALMRAALRRADACTGRRTQLIFRSPAFNFDPGNSPESQEAFSSKMRPLVEAAGMIYVDNFPATYDAVFQRTPHAIKFAKNSAFHYLNAGRYLMAQLLLHALRQLAPVPGSR